MKKNFKLLLVPFIGLLGANSTAFCQESSDFYSPNMIDLGLSVLWADRNVGADEPSDYGILYGWGAEASDEFSSNYPVIDDIRETEYDLCHSHNNGLRMPSYSELAELINKCEWTYTSLNDVPGFNVEGPNGNSIFIPASGVLKKGVAEERNDNAFIWSGENRSGERTASCLHAHSKTYTSNPIFMSFTHKQLGLSLRGVADVESVGTGDSSESEDPNDSVDKVEPDYPATVEIDGLEYTLYRDMTAQVNEQIKTLATHIVIPAYVSWNAEEYEVTSIADNAFTSHSEVISIVMNCLYPKIGKNIFSNMSGLTEFTYNSVGPRENFNYTTNLYYAPPFEDSPNIKSVIIGSDARALIPYMFMDLENVRAIEFPNTLEIINQDCFGSAQDLKTIVLNENLKEIHTAAFGNCTYLETVYYNCIDCTVPYYYLLSSYPPFGDRTPNLSNLVIGENVATIPASGFDKVRTFSSIYVSALEPPLCDPKSNFTADVKNQAVLYVPEGCEDIYRNAPVWSEFKNINSGSGYIEPDDDEFEDVETGVISIEIDHMDKIYDINGREQQSLNPGLNIVIDSNGMVHKVFVN